MTIEKPDHCLIVLYRDSEALHSRGVTCPLICAAIKLDPAEPDVGTSAALNPAAIIRKPSRPDAEPSAAAKLSA